MILVRGVSHKTCPVELRERLAAVSAGDALSRGRALSCAEAVVLSTCNRFEVYAAAMPGREAETSALLERWLEELSGGGVGEAAYALSGSDAVLHLFRVASGLDSLVVGEAEILGQVKHAYESSRLAGMTGKLTNVLFQRALYVGKLARTETGIAVGHVSVASVAVDLASRIFGSLREREVLVLGAGAMAELTSKHLASGKIGKLLVANRTFEKGRELAERFQGEAVRWEAFPGLLSRVDILIGSTGADRPVVTRAMLEEALPARKGRSLFLIDIAMPRDIDDSADQLDHVYLYALRDLETIVNENLERRRAELERADRLVKEKAGKFSEWERTVGTPEEGSLRHAERAPLPAVDER